MENYNHFYDAIDENEEKFRILQIPTQKLNHISFNF